jgi:hypothetical protein
MNSSVIGMTVAGNELYAVGCFTTADGTAKHIAKWDGTKWTNLGSGLDACANALLISGSDIYVGGGFTTAGTNVAGFFAHGFLPVLNMHRVGGSISLDWPSSYISLLPQQNSQASGDGWTAINYPITTNSSTKNVTFPLSVSNQFFRLIGN